MDELASELAGAVERAEEEGRRSRFLGEIAGSIDMDEVLARTLEAGTRLEGVDAALIRLESPEGSRRSRRTGSSADGAEAIAGPPDGSRARAIEVSYRYGDDEADPDEPDRRRPRRPARGERQPGRLSRGLHAEPGPAVRRGRRAPARGADAPRHARDRERPPLPRGAAARRPRRADRAPQPAVLPRDARARVRPRAPLQPAARADRLRPRRLQERERQGRASRPATRCSPRRPSACAR